MRMRHAAVVAAMMFIASSGASARTYDPGFWEPDAPPGPAMTNPDLVAPSTASDPNWETAPSTVPSAAPQADNPIDE